MDPTKVKILLVEDNEQNAYLATFLLEQSGMQITRAATGRDGLRLAQAGGHDAVLLDIQLPDLDGYEIAATLRRDPAFAKVPIIALTSFAMPNEREKAMELGCAGYIEKPIEALRFAEQVRSYIKAP